MASVLALSTRNADLGRAVFAAALLATGLLTTALLALAATLLATTLLATALLAAALLTLAGAGLPLPAALLVRRPERADLDTGAIWHAHRHPIWPDSDARAARPTGRRCAGIGGGRSAVGRSRNRGQHRCTACIRIAGITRGAGRP